MNLYNISLREVTTKQMTIEASSKEDAEMVALNFHFGWSDKSENDRIRTLSTTIEGSVFETPPKLSEGLGHDPVVD